MWGGTMFECLGMLLVVPLTFILIIVSIAIGFKIVEYIAERW